MLLGLHCMANMSRLFRRSSALHCPVVPPFLLWPECLVVLMASRLRDRNLGRYDSAPGVSGALTYVAILEYVLHLQ